MDSSFKNVSALWLEDNKLFWKESTYTKYLFISKNMDKIICDCSLEKINSKIVQQTVNQILICNAMSITTVKTYISVINSILSFAYDNDYKCVERIKITFPKKQKNELKILTQKEQKLLTAYLTKNIDLTKLAILFALYTGIRCGDSNSYTPVSAEVEAYEPIIQKYAKEYGIPEYVELIKAVMMQESGGRGVDPMQAAEGSFNTKYPHEPNGIKDPEYSIQCGVQELKAALTSAEVESPIDMEHIKLALQGYNFGNGYISWAKTNYGGYSYANAVEFSTMQASKLWWSSYGDTQYVAHVLRYYPYGRAFTAGGNQAIVEVALTQVGNQGGQPYWSWYGFDSRAEWCACFVSWCADQCGCIESGLVPKFAGCVDGANWFKSNGKWQNRTYEPKAGDIIFFDWEGDGTTDHVGIVEKCENGIVYTVEGNSHDACKQNQYAVGSSSIYGYGVPAY